MIKKYITSRKFPFYAVIDDIRRYMRMRRM